VGVDAPHAERPGVEGKAKVAHVALRAWAKPSASAWRYAGPIGAEVQSERSSGELPSNLDDEVREEVRAHHADAPGLEAVRVAGDHLQQVGDLRVEQRPERGCVRSS
jgi:hypothetical protein